MDQPSAKADTSISSAGLTYWVVNTFGLGFVQFSMYTSSPFALLSFIFAPITVGWIFGLLLVPFCDAMRSRRSGKVVRFRVGATVTALGTAVAWGLGIYFAK
jgi:hypothetical protein